MKRILCTSIVMLALLTACSTPTQVPESSAMQGENAANGIYEFSFDTVCLSGVSSEGWDFVYTYNGEEIQSGHQILFSLGTFSFHSVQVDVIERDNPQNSYSATFQVAVCNGGSGKTEITVTDSTGKTATYQVICKVMRVG